MAKKKELPEVGEMVFYPGYGICRVEKHLKNTKPDYCCPADLLLRAANSILHVASSVFAEKKLRRRKPISFYRPCPPSALAYHCWN